MENIICYIKEKLKNPQAANELLEEVMNDISNRAYNPKSYEKYVSYKDRKDTYYRIYVKNYVIFYTVKDNIMEIRRMLFGKSDFQKYQKF